MRTPWAAACTPSSSSHRRCIRGHRPCSAYTGIHHRTTGEIMLTAASQVGGPRHTNLCLLHSTPLAGLPYPLMPPVHAGAVGKVIMVMMMGGGGGTRRGAGTLGDAVGALGRLCARRLSRQGRLGILRRGRRQVMRPHYHGLSGGVMKFKADSLV